MARRCIDHLIQEHKLILRAVYVLEAMAADASEARLPESSDVEKLLTFLRQFADDHHQGKEEAVLFPAVRITAGIPAGPLQHMMFEHAQELTMVEGLESALRTQDCTDFAHCGARLAQTLSNHIYKEDNILFFQIEQRIDDDADSKIVDEMLAMDERFGATRRLEMTQIVTYLEWKYLSKAP